jgi:diguanylate cyclase (GGDEF)-like protein
MLAANVAQVVTTLSILVAWREEAELELRRQAVTDVLTGLLNRRGWGELAVPQLASAHRHGIAVALLAIDLDHFKRVNDVYGHAVGDQALRLLGRLLQKEQRAGDCVARLGGEEFGMLLSYTGVEAAARFDARLRAAVRAATLAELGFAMEFSSGLAALRENESMEDLLKRADAACYVAKSQGRGRLVLAESENSDAQLQTA